MEFRNELRSSDIANLKEIMESTGFFYDFEVEVALELAQENLKLGEEKSGYVFIVVEEYDKPVAFSCYGKNTCTFHSYDLYWMVVHQNQKGKGIGRTMLKMVEEDVARLGGKKLWIETSSRQLYEPTRAFYAKTACEKVAELPDYYGENDSKIVYLKRL